MSTNTNTSMQSRSSSQSAASFLERGINWYNIVHDEEFIIPYIRCSNPKMNSNLYVENAHRKRMDDV